MNDNIELLVYREYIYRMLSSIYLYEIDEEMLETLSLLEAAGSNAYEIPWQQDINKGFEMISAAAKEGVSLKEPLKKEFLEELAADYAATFLAAGSAHGKAAFPYETAYTGPESLFGGSVQQQLNALYASRGYKMRADMFRVMEDHIGLEMCFMAEILKERISDADAAYTDANPALEKSFFKKHLSGWACLFANDVYKYSKHNLYKGVAFLTRGFIQAEKAYLTD